MTSINGLAMVAEIRLILNDTGTTVDNVTTYLFSESDIVKAINLASRRLVSDRPAACYGDPNTFTERVELTGTGTAGVLASTDVIAIDQWWQSALAHCSCYFLFTNPDRSTVNVDFASREMKRYQEMI